MDSRIQRIFAQCEKEKRACFVAYVCAGDPDFETSIEVCRTLIDSGIDILELGVPFSDPLADGLTNQLAAQRALDSGMTSHRVFEFVKSIRAFSSIPIVFYTYYNLVFAQGSSAYAKRAKAAGVDALLTLDLPPEEALEHLDACEQSDIETVFIVAPTTPEERLVKICEATTGFIYYVSREGVTGEQSRLSNNIQSKVSTIKKYTHLPVVVGFGVSSAEHVQAISAVADGVVVGSAIVNCIAENASNNSEIQAALSTKLEGLLSNQALKKS
jgi:tryptophan synthase alpha chain